MDYKLRVIGWDRRHNQKREAVLVYKKGELFLMIAKRIPKPSKYAPKGVLAIDVNEKEMVFGSNVVGERRKTAIERALYYKRLAERLQQKYSSNRYNAWLRRKGRSKEDQVLP